MLEVVCNGDREMGRSYEATHNPLVDHDTDVLHVMETRCTKSSVVARTDNQCQMVAHRLMEDTQSRVKGCVDHPPFE